MFYATKLKAVSGDKAVDEQGKVLSFIGYLPVEAGDTVFTDGTVIFGNVKVKGDYNLFVEEPASGIPVLADSSSTSNKKLRGYFEQSGKFRNYNVAGKNWLVNSENIFAHDKSEAKIIDAEIALNDSGKEVGVYTVEKKIDKILAVTNDQNGDYITVENQLARDCQIIIKKDNNAIDKIQLSTLSKEAEKIAADYVNFVEVHNHTPTDKLSSVAWLRNFKVMPDGSWQALVDFHILASRSFRGKDSVLNVDTTRTESENKSTIPSNFPWGGNREAIAEAFRKMGFSKVTTDIILRDSALAKSFYSVFYETLRPTYSEWTIQYSSGPIKITQEDTGKDYSTTAYCVLLFSFSSDGSIKKVFEKSYCTPLKMYVSNYEGSIDGQVIPNSKHIDATKDKNTYPYISLHLSYKQILSGYSWWLDIISFRGNAILKTFREQNWTYCDTICNSYCYDSRNLPNAPPYNKYFYSFDQNFSFPIQDGYSAKLNFTPLSSGSEKAYICSFDNIFNENGEAIANSEIPFTYNAHEWNTALVPLKNGAFLFGCHDGNLYKITSGKTPEIAGSGLKNFRLRELKKMSKAKK